MNEQEIGPEGGTISIEKTGTPVDGIRLVIPAGALERRVKIVTSREAGTLHLETGESSGAFLRISAGTLNSFQRPVDIEVTFDPARMKGRMLTGYAIKPNGRLAAVTLKSLDRASGKATFSTMVPLFFTWVHCPIP